MCLSTAYEYTPEENRFLCKNVMRVRIEDGRVIMTDIMGTSTEVEGRLKSLDLVENVILIEPAAS